MSEVKIQVNVLNQLRLLRQSTFKDPLSFLDEDVQNAQRAKATEVRITTNWSENILIIENNGAILDNPQKLFSIAESGWDDETVKNESPFGIGFFSNISVSDNIKIYTGTKLIDFNVKLMLETGDVTLPVIEGKENFEGFRLELHNFDYNNLSVSKIKRRATNLGRYVQDVEVYINDEKVVKKDLTEATTSSPFVMSVDENNCKGWLAISENFTNNLTVFHKGREVARLDKYYVEGELHVENSALSLVAPDRKDIIKDNKYSAFMSVINDYLEVLATDAALNGTTSQQEDYADSIQYYANIEKAKDKMKFIVVRCNNEGIQYINKVITAKKEEGITGSGVTNLFLDEQAAIQPESHLEEVFVENEVPYAGPTTHSSYGGGYGGSSYTPLVSENQKEEEKGATLFSTDRPKFWVSEKDLVKWETKVLICKHYDLCLVISANKFQDKILENLEKESKVFHLRTLSQRIIIKTSLSDTILSGKEKRALQIFDMLSRITGLSNNAFAIGNLMVTRVLTIPEIGIEEEKVEENVLAIYCDDYNKVYVDRSLLENADILTDDLVEELNLQDYKFVLRNLDTLVKELQFTSSKHSSDLMSIIIKTLGGE